MKKPKPMSGIEVKQRQNQSREKLKGIHEKWKKEIALHLMKLIAIIELKKLEGYELKKEGDILKKERCKLKKQKIKIGKPQKFSLKTGKIKK